MNTLKEEEQRSEFRNILFDLAKSQETLQDPYKRSRMYRRLENLYASSASEKRFRHFYSDIFSVLTQIRNQAELGDINILGQNLDIIRNGYNPQNIDDDKQTIDVSDSIKKLYDHVNLDIARICYYDAENREISGKSSLEHLQGEINVVRQNLTEKSEEMRAEAERKMDQVEKRLNDAQKDYIAILGIFAAVVLAFTGGIAFSTSVLNNIAQASIYRTIAVSLIIGLVLVNILFGLFYYVNSLVNKEKKLWPLVISNAIFLFLLCLLFVAWNNGCVEKRHLRINTGSFRNDELQEKEFSLGMHLQELQCYPSFISEIK